MEVLKLRTELIPLDKIIPHESAATEIRTSRVPSHKDYPVIVRKIENSEYYYLIQGHNRIYNALKARENKVTSLVATPSFNYRQEQITLLRKKQSEKPIESLRLVKDDIERQNLFYSETEPYQIPISIATDKGTIIKIYFEIEFSEKIKMTYFLLPLKANLGGVIFNVDTALELFEDSFLNKDHIKKSWGLESEYDPSVLPSYIALGVNGCEYSPRGFYYDIAFCSAKIDWTYDIVNRGKVKSVRVIVLYPNGLIYEGPIEQYDDDSIAIIWSTKLALKLRDKEIFKRYQESTNWWKRPTSLILSNAKPPTGGCRYTHGCGSTCEGGGCEM